MQEAHGGDDAAADQQLPADAPSTPEPGPARRRGVKRWITPGLMVLLLVFIALAVRQQLTPPPSAFNQAVTLQAASEASKASGRPMLVFAGASWCVPCSMFKRAALADERVIAWITANTEPVYLDIDKQPEAAAEFGVRAIPSLMLVKEGSIVDRIDGAQDTDRLLAWLRASR
jgi:thioredoxin 2